MRHALAHRRDSRVAGSGRRADGTSVQTGTESGNRVTLLVDGGETYASMFAALEGARHHVHVETYIIQNDGVGNRFADALLECRQRGIGVRLIYDGFGSTADEDFWKKLEDAGVELHCFNPPHPVKNLKFARYDLRDHRKILIVDGRIGFTGGVNFYDAYALPREARRGSNGSGRPAGDGSLSGKLPWRDTHVRIEGPAVAMLQRVFVSHWEEVEEVSLPQDGLFPGLEPLGDEGVSFDIGVGGDDDESDIYFTYLERFEKAQRYIWITQAYFVPDERFLRALTDAAGRGVDVQIIAPAKTDVKPILYASRHLYGELLAAGARIFEYEDAVLHAKTAVIDGQWSTVGSSNLDYLSFVRNHEVNAVITGRAFAQEMERLFRSDLEHAREISLEEWRRAPFTRRLAGQLACRFREWF